MKISKVYYHIHIGTQLAPASTLTHKYTPTIITFPTLHILIFPHPFRNTSMGLLPKMVLVAQMFFYQNQLINTLEQEVTETDHLVFGSVWGL